MPKRLPSHCHHKASGQGVVRLDGRDYYTGRWKTHAAKAEYDRLVALWLSGSLDDRANDLTIGEVSAKYWQFAQAYYIKNGQPTDEQGSIRCAFRPLLMLYEDEPAAEFGPLALKAVRERMIEVRHCRNTINKNVDRIRRMFKWAESEQLVPRGSYETLRTVSGLQHGRSQARETKPIGPVSDEHVEAVLKHLPAVVGDMVRFQRLTGCRPNEVCQLRPCDLDRSADVWRYTPLHHKTQHRGRSRIILIGPRAQSVLARYLARGPEMYCFRPIDSEAKRRAAQHANRKTPINAGNAPGSNRKQQPKRKPKDRYDVDSYRRAIERACTKARIPRWSPNQLRHAAGTEIRALFGLESAQCILGHATANVTQVYAQRDLEKGVSVARQIG